MDEKGGRAYVGTSGWKKPQWRGGFYPTGLAQRRELEFASRQFTSLEINSTFHGLQRPSTFATWRAETPDDFVFTVKGYKAVTRAPSFRNARKNLADFFASGVLDLREKLGPLLWQLPAETKFNAESLERFLSLLPQSVFVAAELSTESSAATDEAFDGPDRKLRHAIEVRDPSFLDTAFVELLHVHGIAVAFTNAPESPGFRELPSDFVYIRLSSGEDHHANGYDDASLKEWAARITDWVDGSPPRDVFTYFKNPAGLLPHTPHNAVRLLRMLGQDGAR
jgi:uncharacterized protein YecE (DUF72 family)